MIKLVFTPLRIALSLAAFTVVAIGISRASARPPSCRTDYRARLLDGRKRLTPALIVLHSTEGPSAESAASWFTDEAAQGSAHVVVGEDGCFRTLPDDANAAGAGEVNPYALHLEFAGYAAWSRDRWLSRRKTLELGREQVRAWARQYGIPLRKLTRSELRDGQSGVTTHADVSAVFGGTHTDPGTGFPFSSVV